MVTTVKLISGVAFTPARPDEVRLGLVQTNLDRLVARLRQQMHESVATYGDSSFTRPAASLIDEIQQELEDDCGWSLLLWIRLDRLHARVEQERNGGNHHG